MFEIKFLRDCTDFDFSSSLDRHLLDLSLNNYIETLALVSDGVIYDYGPSVKFSDSYGHTITISNDCMNHFVFFFGKLYLAKYSTLDSLNYFFRRFIEEL